MAPNSTVLTNIVATSTVAVATATIYHAWSQRQLQKQHSPATTVFKIPEKLLQSPHANELQLAVRLAQHAGRNMKEYLEAKGTSEESKFDLGIETKSSSADFCTKIDVENEKLVIEGITQAYKEWNSKLGKDESPLSFDIIGEESVGTGPLPKLKKDVPTWIIDPIDGTTNFSQGIFMTCVSIGYCVDGKPVMGVIYAPATEELYVAVKGFGAYRNGVPILQKNPKKSLAQAVVCCEFGYARKKEHIDLILSAVSKLMGHGCRSIRQLGSGCLDLCYVATGRIDVVYAGIANEQWKPWDYCAGIVICEEAGCIIEEIHQEPGKEFNMYGDSVLCGVSRELVDETRTVLTS